MVIPSPGKAPAVSVQQATLSYADRLLFKNLNLHLAAAQCTCLLGVSGSGKTTLLRLIAGLTSDVQGSAIVACDDAHPLPGRIAWMAQQDLLLPWLTITDNVLLGSRLRGESVGPEQRERARIQLANTGLAECAQQLPGELSGGMRQRAALARTLYEDRPVVLMDEPFSALDAITRHRLQTLTAKWLTDRTVLLITHDPLEALRLGHTIYVLQGRPARLGEALHLHGQPPRELEQGDLSTLYPQLLQRLQRSAAINPC